MKINQFYGIDNDQEDSIVYFSDLIECDNFFNNPPPLDHIKGILLPDEELMTKFQYKFYSTYCDIGSEASILNCDDYKINDSEEYDFYCHVHDDSLDDYYRIYSKMSCKKWVVCCEDDVASNLFSKFKNQNLTLIDSFNEELQSKCKCVIEIPEFRRFPPKRIGIALCQNKPIIVMYDKHFYDGYRNLSYWDMLLTSHTCRMNAKHAFEERALSFLQNYKYWIKPREYYKTFLGKENLLKRML